METKSEAPDAVPRQLPPEAHSGIVTLDQIEPEHCAQVAEVRAGDTEIERLKAMGLCVGRRLMMVRAGDPMIVKVLGSRIGISARLARSVMVFPCGGDAFAGS